MAYTFPMEHQQETDWCWCAVAVSMEHYFDPHSRLTQDAFAPQALGVASLAEADQPWYLSQALKKLDMLAGNPPGYLSFDDVRLQLDQNLPVCVHIAWNGGGSHFVVITGYEISPERTLVCVSDPLLQAGNHVLWDYDAFVFAYSPNYANAEGTWVDTCLVKPLKPGGKR